MTDETRAVRRYMVDTHCGDPVLVTKTDLGFLHIERYMDDAMEVVTAPDHDAHVRSLPAAQAEEVGRLREALTKHIEQCSCDEDGSGAWECAACVNGRAALGSQP